MIKRVMTVLSTLLFAAAVADVTLAQEGSPSGGDGDGQHAECDTIRAVSEKFVEAFNAADAKGLASHWTQDGDYVAETGETFKGRAEIASAYARFFEEHPGTKMRIVIDSLRLLSDDAAIEDGRAIMEPIPAGAPAMSKYTAVHVKVDGKWLMSTVRDERIETPSAYHNVADLEWLIGTWKAEEHGAKTEAVCAWAANKSFVQRNYTVTHHDGTATSGVQIIGFNPEAGHVQSWNFSSDGGHAVGVWMPHGNGWSARLHGTTGDGASTSATNVLTRLDDNAYAWQSIERSVGGQSLPDTDEIIIRRQTN